MGEREKTGLKVVLDTNVLISALLFRGELAQIVELWKTGKIIPLLTRETFEEFRQVLEYPRFSLTHSEIKTLVEDEVLPFFEVVETGEKITGVCRDAEDDKFIACALSGRADFVVSGDKDLLEIGKHKTVKIISGRKLLGRL